MEGRGKRENLLPEKGKGKAPGLTFSPRSHPHRHRAHARTTRNDFPVELSLPTSDFSYFWGASFGVWHCDLTHVTSALSPAWSQRKMQKKKIKPKRLEFVDPSQQNTKNTKTSEVGEVSPTEKSFRVVRACARCLCEVRSG